LFVIGCIIILPLITWTGIELAKAIDLEKEEVRRFEGVREIHGKLHVTDNKNNTWAIDGNVNIIVPKKE
jgi:hypothetical protein